MRIAHFSHFTHFIALVTAAGAITHTADAQERRSAPAPDARSRSTEARVFRLGENEEAEHRAALGVGTSSTGTPRDTLGLLVTSVTRGSPAERAGIEEGNRIAAINGVSLRVNAADVEDGEMTGALTRRLTRELAKAKPGDEVELRVYRDGRTSALKVKTADSDSLFRRREIFRTTRSEQDERPALGFGLGSSGSRRDTLGVLVMSVSDSSPAARAGLEEGNRIAAINGVSLRVSREDAEDRFVGQAKAQRLQRAVAALRPGDNVTLRVYANGQFRDVSMKVARAGDLPRRRGVFYMGDGMSGGEFMAPMPPMMPMTPMPRMPAMPGMPAMPVRPGMDGMHVELGPELRVKLNNVRSQMQLMRPQLERLRMELPALLERVRVNSEIHVDLDADER